MAIFLVVFLSMLIFVALMSIGVMFGKDPIKGSCGGIANINTAFNIENKDCPICGGNVNKCEENILAHDATK